MNFEWDEAKNRENIQKHGLDFRDAKKIFEGSTIVDLDLRRDYGEDRWKAIGWLGNRTVVVIYTEPTPQTTRIISFRKALTYEREEFEQAIRNRLGPR